MLLRACSSYVVDARSHDWQTYESVLWKNFREMSLKTSETSGGGFAAETPETVVPNARDDSQLPRVLVKSEDAGVQLNLGDLWAYRELLYFLTWRDVKVRYKQTLVGVAWVVMQPLLSTLIFTVFLGNLARVPSDGAPYPLFVFAGLLPWTFFASAVSGAGPSLVGSSNLITKVYFPRMFIPAASVSARLLDFLISFAVLAGLLLYYGVPLTWRLFVWLPPLVALIALLALGIGMWAAAVNVKYRDVGVVLPVLVQFWMFASPVVYPSSLIYSSSVSPFWKRLYMLNPLVGIIEGFRSATFGRPVDVSSLAFSVAVTVVVLLCAAYTFRGMEKSFADVV